MAGKCLANALVAAAAFLTSSLWADASPELKSAVDRSLKAMGAENVKTIVISGEGGDGCVGQPYNPNSAWWRRFSDKSYVRSVDLDARGWRLQRVRAARGFSPGRARQERVGEIGNRQGQEVHRPFVRRREQRAGGRVYQ